jgi:hypothetical protein
MCVLRSAQLAQPCDTTSPGSRSSGWGLAQLITAAQAGPPSLSALPAVQVEIEKPLKLKLKGSQAKGGGCVVQVRRGTHQPAPCLRRALRPLPHAARAAALASAQRNAAHTAATATASSS